jgi:hypothetical protein
MATRKCKRGSIYRVGYTRKNGSRVKGACIRDVGRPGKGFPGGPGIGALKSGELAQFGYSDVIHKSATRRHASLTRAVKKYGSLSVWRKLNAVQVYTRRLSPPSSKIFKADMNWVRSKYGIKA